MKLLFRYSLLAALLLPSLPVQGGDGDTDQRFSIDLTMAGLGSNGTYLPLFLTTNEYGIVGVEGDQLYLRPTVNYQLKRHNFTLDGVADLVFYGSTDQAYYASWFNVQQLYARASWKNYVFTLGRQQRKQRIVTRELSSGNMILSANAHPAIGLGFGMRDYIHMKVLGDKVEVYADAFWGRQTDGEYNADLYRQYESNYGPQGVNDPRQHSGIGEHLVQNPWMHYATLMFRSESDLPFYVNLGVEHAAMYGGTIDGKNQNSFHGHLLAALGGKGRGKHGLNSQYNQMLAFDGKLKLKRKRWSTAVYRQIYADDLDGNVFRCGMDGLTGVELRFHRKPFFKLLVFEYLQTTNQGGVVYANDYYDRDGHRQHYATAGNSNFYHDEWYGAWAHRGMAWGNPLLASPAYNKDGYNDFSMNIVRAFNFGMMGRFIEELSYRFRYCFQTSWGTPYYPIGHQVYNNSANLDLQYDWGPWQFVARVAYDCGKIYGSQWGYGATISHKGEIFEW